MIMITREDFENMINCNIAYIDTIKDEYIRKHHREPNVIIMSRNTFMFLRNNLDMLQASNYEQTHMILGMKVIIVADKYDMEVLEVLYE